MGLAVKAAQAVRTKLEARRARLRDRGLRHRDWAHSDEKTINLLSKTVAPSQNFADHHPGMSTVVEGRPTGRGEITTNPKLPSKTIVRGSNTQSPRCTGSPRKTRNAQ
eukprot:1500641-Pyramimonas_sp.AAC.1